MKKTLLAGVAALSVLSASAAHAYPPRYYNCGKAFVKIEIGKGTAPSGRRVFPATWTIQENWKKEDAKNLPPIGSLNFKCTKDEKCWFNGELCRHMSVEEGHKEFLDAEEN